LPQKPQRRVARFLRRHPGGQVLLDLALQMKLKLVVELLFFLTSPKEGTY